MKIENPVALQFILQDDIYLLNKDRNQYATTAIDEQKGDVSLTIVLEDTPPVNFNYMGKNKAAFLVLTHYTNNEHIADAHLAALENILKRKELVIDDVAILNVANHTTAGFDDLLKHFNPKKLLILGSKAQPQNITPLVLNVPKLIENTMTLYSFSFDEMMDSNENKKAFWDQMKSL